MRFTFLGNGRQEWGSGAAVADTNLYRSGVGILTTDGKIEALTGIKLTNSSTVGYVWKATDTVGNGSWQAGGGGISRSVSSIATNTTGGATASTDYVYLCTATLTLTLPTAVGNTNQYSIKNIGGVTTIATTSAQTIDGSTSATLSIQYGSLTIVSDGANWNII